MAFFEQLILPSNEGTVLFYIRPMTLSLFTSHFSLYEGIQAAGFDRKIWKNQEIFPFSVFVYRWPHGMGTVFCLGMFFKTFPSGLMHWPGVCLVV